MLRFCFPNFVLSFSHTSPLPYHGSVFLFLILAVFIEIYSWYATKFTQKTGAAKCLTGLPFLQNVFLLFGQCLQRLRQLVGAGSGLASAADAFQALDDVL